MVMSRLFRDVDGGALFPHGSVVCIGAFDGLHLGHRALVRRAVARAQELRLPAVALSFEPLPREFFSRELPPPRLTLARGKYQGLRALGADSVGLLRFDARLSAMSAQDFVHQLLVARLGAREVWIGPDFRFGHRRGGDLALLQELGTGLGFTANEIEPVQLKGERVSSTRIREALRGGDFTDAGAAGVARMPPTCWAGRTPSVGGSCAASSWAARSGFPPPTCVSRRRLHCRASMRLGCMV